LQISEKEGKPFVDELQTS